MENFLKDDDFLARWVTWALWALALIVCIATVTGQVESYNGLYIWFATHHVTGFWADFAPLTVDSFTIIGELAIFAGIARHWPWVSRIIPWCSALLGICASVAANVGDKVQYHSIPTDFTGAIFPLAGAFGIVIGLGVLKRTAKDAADRHARALAKAEVKAEVLEIEPVAGPSIETLKRIEEKQKEISPEPPRLKGLDALIPPRAEPNLGALVQNTRASYPDFPTQRHGDRIIETGAMQVIPEGA